MAVKCERGNSRERGNWERFRRVVSTKSLNAFFHDLRVYTSAVLGVSRGSLLHSFAQEMCPSHNLYTTTFSQVDQRQSCEPCFSCLQQSAQSVWPIARDSGCSSAAKLDVWQTYWGIGLSTYPNRLQVHNRQSGPESGAQIWPYCVLSVLCVVDDILRLAGLTP